VIFENPHSGIETGIRKGRTFSCQRITFHSRYRRISTTLSRLPVRNCVLRTFPFSIVYLDDPDSIRIVAVAHHKSRPGYWKSRL